MKEVSKDAKALMLLLLVNSILFTALYFVFVHFGFDYILLIYCAVGAMLAVGFVIYNRGFAWKGVTPEMLPDTMSYVEKCQFIEDGKARLRKSRWVLTVIFPIILAVAIDMMILFLFPMMGITIA
ncbi:MAG: hypothetical protein IJX80_05805 [Clostridia bacterium]|nr:hypothetical protein [Clostridia bacterium]